MSEEKFVPWPLGSAEQLADALREQDIPVAEARELAVPLQEYLSAWQAPKPTESETLRLVGLLQAHLPIVSSVRQFLQERSVRWYSRLYMFLIAASAQVNLLQPAFWYVSALVVCLGALVIFGTANVIGLFWLRTASPLLAYLGTYNAFRNVQEGVAECELTCPPSLWQITCVRLLIVLSYNIGVGLLLALLLWTHHGGSFLLLTLHWLMPLFLITGFALFLSLFLSIMYATSIAYAIWFVLTVLSLAGYDISGTSYFVFSTTGELALASLGLILLVVAMVGMQIARSRFLPRF